MNACFDEGTLQAHLDGELDAARAAAVAAHVRECETCAAVLAEAAGDFALLSSALDVEEPLSVPTERLRARIDAAIAELQPAHAPRPAHIARPSHVGRPATSASLVERLRAFAGTLAAGLAAPRQATAFASLLVAAVLLAGLFYVFRPGARPNGQTGPVEIARVNLPTGASPPTGASAGREGVANNPGAGNREENRATTSGVGGGQAAGPVETGAAGTGAGRRGGGRPALNREARTQGGPVGFVAASDRRHEGVRDGAARSGVGVVSEAALLPVEKSYAEAVASLKSSIERQKAQTMTPTLRAEYERNLAIVDRAIVASRAAARRDPADKGAQEFLRAAYQDKLDLLRTVADQTQIASIGR